MSIFVDGVEIESLFVNGFEQLTAEVDGVEVFSKLEFMFDDFNRSGNGTTIPNHTSNTGQLWLPGEFDGGNTVIRGSVGGQGFGRDSVAAGYTAVLSPQLDKRPASFYCKTRYSTLLTGGIFTSMRIFIGSTTPGGGGNNTWVAYSKNSGLLQCVNDLEIASVTHPSPLSQLVDLEIWTDGVDMQGRVFTNGSSVTTARVAISNSTPDIMRSGETYIQESSFGSNTRPHIYEYTFQEFTPATVPWP